MARVESLAMLNTEGGKLYLAETYGKTIENIQKMLVSGDMKNRDLSGDPTSGSVEAKRFANATPKAYGTARAAGKGDSVSGKPVLVPIDTPREIVEEAQLKDIMLSGVDGWFDRRAANHVISMANELDTKFFSVARAAANEVIIAGDAAIEDELEAVIQECENTKNSFVNGVPRAMMRLVMNTAYYGKVRNQLDKTSRANVDTTAEEFYAWHGVAAKSCVNLPAGTRYLLMVDGAVAQPCMSTPYSAEKVPLSNATAVELFFDYGTVAVTPDLIFTGVSYTAVTIQSFADGVTYYTKSGDTYAKVTGAYASGTTYYVKS